MQFFGVQINEKNYETCDLDYINRQHLVRLFSSNGAAFDLPGGFMPGHGLIATNTDFLICAVAACHSLPIFTSDGDFALFQPHVPITLHQPRA